MPVPVMRVARHAVTAVSPSHRESSSTGVTGVSPRCATPPPDVLPYPRGRSMIPKIELRIEIDDEGPSALAPAIAYAAIRTLAKLLTQLAPMSAFTALITTLFWLAAAIYLFVVLTWMRDDNWLGGGLIIGATLFCGGTIAELVG